MSSGFSLGAAAREEVANLRASMARSIVAAALVAAVGAAAMWLTLADVSRVESLRDRAVAAGRYVLILSSSSEEGVTAAECDGINAISGVKAAGGIESSSEVEAVTGGTFTLHTVTPGFIGAAWDASYMGAEVIATSDLAERYGLVAGGIFGFGDDQTSATYLQIESVATVRSRVGGLNDSLIVVAAPEGRVRECLVSVVPASYEDVGAALRGWLGPQTTVVDFLPPSELGPDPRASFSARISAFGWLAASILTTALLGLNWFSRRSEFAVYRLLHASERHLVAMLTTDVIILGLLPLSAGGFVILVVGAPLGSLTSLALLVDWARLLLATVLVPLIGLAIVPRSGAWGSIRGR